VRNRLASAAWLTLGLALAAVPSAGGGEVPGGPAGDAACAVPEPLRRLEGALAASRSALQRGAGLTVVALGSSSTQGHGASAADRTYPAQLEAVLRRRHPAWNVRVLNRGVGGETAGDMLRRFARDVHANRPALVLWQVGANDAVREVPAERLSAELDDGLAGLRAAGIDVVLVPPQHAARLARAPQFEATLAVLERAALRHNVALFARERIMRALPEAERQRLLGADGLHLNDLGYLCLATQLADAIDGLLSAPPPLVAER